MKKSRRAKRARTDVSCKSATDLIWKYLSDRLRPAVKRAFEEHLRICPDCVSFLNTYKKTVSLARSLGTGAMPAKVRANARAFLRQHMGHTAAFLLCLIQLTENYAPAVLF